MCPERLRWWSTAVAILAGLLTFSPLVAAQTTEIRPEYVGTMYAPLDTPQVIDNTLFIYNVQEGGWFKGPGMNASIVAPAGDWLRLMPGGAARLDVRLTLKTDDGALIYVSYNGVISHTKESWDRLMKGETLTSKDHYFTTAPTMQTSAEKYAWVNHVQFAGRIVEVKVGAGSYVKYDIFALR